jgi:DNA-binding GntR family transcriptional regulator
MSVSPLQDAARISGRLTAHEYVRQAVRSAILSGAIRGGDRLIQADLATQLGVSTTPVRVKQLEYDELVEIQSLTRLLDPEAMRRVAETGGDEGALAQAETLSTAMETESDIGRWVDLNRQFHELLATPLVGTRLHSMLQGLRAAAAPYIALALQQQEYQFTLAHQHHRAFVEVIRSRDTEAAQALAREHVDLTTKTLEAAHDTLFGSTGQA